MRARLVLTAPCLLTAAALALGACSGGASSAQDLTWEDSPLYKAMEEFYGGVEEDPEEWERQDAERQRQVEEITATCMAEEGFEYTPAVYDGGGGSISVEDEDWGSAEWVAQYGYGITTDPWAEEQTVEPVDEWVDPNAAYVESMSQAEQDAYYEALYGPGAVYVEGEDDEWVDVEEPQEYNWQDGGCQGRAYHEVYEQDGSVDEEMWEDPAFTEFFAAAERLYEDALSDPRTQEVSADWAECMADAGISGMTTPDDVQNQLYEEFDKLYMAADAGVDWEKIDWENVPDTFDPVGEAMDQDALAALKEREIATAVADHKCQEDLDIQSRYLQVQFELEEKFIETYRAELDALIATYGQAS